MPWKLGLGLGPGCVGILNGRQRCAFGPVPKLQAMARRSRQDHPAEYGDDHPSAHRPFDVQDGPLVVRKRDAGRLAQAQHDCRGHQPETAPAEVHCTRLRSALGAIRPNETDVASANTQGTYSNFPPIVFLSLDHYTSA